MSKIKMKKREIVLFVKALENPPESLQFRDFKVAHNLIKIKNDLKDIYEGLKLADRPAQEFIEYQRQAQKLQMQLSDDQTKLSEELNELAAKNMDHIESEINRRKKLDEELEDEVTVDLLKVKAADIIGNGGNGKDLLRFLSDIQPVLEFESETAKA
jgi:hypothetical protein